MACEPPLTLSQKALSAIRCIKTVDTFTYRLRQFLSQKAPSAIRCIKTLLFGGGAVLGVLSEST